jgi:hypothetical protein
MDRRLATMMLEEVLGRPAKDFSGVSGCWIGFLGSTTIVSFHAKSAPGPGWGPLTLSDVEGMLESLAKELPGLALDPRPSGYDLLGASRNQDDNGNFTKHFLLRRRDTGRYLLIREYAG